MACASARTRLGRSEWIAAAVEILGREGVDAVRVEVLAKRLGVTKGSFYHHFTDRDELLRAVLDLWHERATSHVIELCHQHSRRPEERLRRLLELVIERRRPFGFFDVGVREWARKDRRAQSMLESVDAERLAHIAERLLALGCEPQEAETRAHLIYSHILGEAHIARNDSQSVRRQRLESCLRRLVLDLPGVGRVEELPS
jgi:AcrR family transcriptional regulator